MSGFCVFGISRSVCKARIEKKIDPIIPGNPPRYMTPIEWGGIVNSETDKAFQEQTRLEKISPVFDSPQFCKDWINVNPSEIRNAVIMYRGEKIDKHGGTVTRNGAPVMTWIEYDPKKSISRPFGEVST